MLLLLSVLGLVFLAMGSRQLWRKPGYRWVWGMAAGLVVIIGLALRDPIAQKVAGRLVMPVGLLWVSLFAIGARAVWHRHRNGAFLAFGGFLSVMLIGGDIFGAALLVDLQNRAGAVSPYAGEPFDAVVVLGGGTKPGPYHPELGIAGDRVMLAGRLFRAGRTPILVASGRSLPGLEATDLARDTADIWMAMGIPSEAIIQLPDPYNTKQELLAYRELIEKRGWSRVGLLTSGYHLPRALRHAERLGLSVWPLAADHHAAESISVLSVVPHGVGFFLMDRAIWEWVGQMVGR